MLEVWKEKILERISSFHYTTIVNTGRKTNMEIKKPYAVVQYNKLVKGV